jgi:hypothetical protein
MTTIGKGRRTRALGRALAGGAGLAAGAYAAYAATTWLRYGHAQAAEGDEADRLLDRFMPAYEIAERHHMRVQADTPIAFAAACDMDLQQSAIVRAIFNTREIVLGARHDSTPRPRGIVEFTKSIGWGVLAEIPGREIVMGAVTQPWEANVTFHALAPDAFVPFDRPEFVKIAWTLRADGIGPGESIVRTETRVMTTDAVARRKFRRYWSVFSPGIVLIRHLGLRLVKSDAERRARLESID